MTQIVATITHDDGTVDSFGPVEITKKLAGELIRELKPYEEGRQEEIEASRTEEIEAEQEHRSAVAEAYNDRRVELAAEGIDPDSEEGRRRLLRGDD